MRKQFIIILLACLVLVGLTVSCKNEVEPAQFGEELVSVSFEEDSARGLTATLEAFDKGEYYWTYAAQKADTSKLLSGQTATYDEAGALPVSAGNKGLGSGTGIDYKPYKVPGFSQGYWNFKLYAYKTCTGAGTAQSPYVYSELVYSGEVLNVVLKNDSVNTEGAHSVKVIVNPAKTTENGTLLVDTTSAKKITLNTVSTDAVYTIKVLSVEDIVPEGATPTEYVGSSAETQVADNTHNGLFSLPAGSYKVTVAFSDSGNTVNYARGMVVATVYSNLTTTIGGDLTEAMTYAEFDSELNPELVTVTISKDGIPVYDVEQETEKTVKIVTDTSAAKAVTAEIRKADTNTLITDLATKINTNTDEYNQALKLTLKVETVEVEENTATYEIGMSAMLTSTNKATEAKTSTTSDVTSVADYVTVTVQLQTGLTAVTVLHSGVPMIEGLDSQDPDDVGLYEYNASNGVLTIKTKTFSPFKVTYTAPAESVYVAKIGNYKYTSLKNAVDNAKAGTSAEAFGDTIVLLADYTLAEGEALSKNYVALDLAGHTLTVPSGKTLTLSGTGAAVITGSIALPGAEPLVLSGNNSVVSDVTVTGGTISVSGTGVEIEDCVIDSGDYVAINMASTGSATIDGGTYTATSGILSNGNITVVDGVFKGTIVNGTGAGITLTGGTYNEALPEVNQITIPNGYEYKKVADNVYNILKKTVVRNVTKGIEYYTLNAAFEAADSGDGLLLLNSTEVSSEIEIAAGKTLSLDLGGKVITGTEHAKSKAVFRNAGNLTIVGTTAGSAINADATAVASIAGSTLTVNGGSYSNSYLVDNAGAYLFDVNGTATINGVTLPGIVKGIRAEGAGASVTVSESSADVTPGWGLFAAAYQGELTISSGNYKTTYDKQQQMIDIKEDGKVTINGGSFETVFDGTGDAPALVVFNNEVQTTTGEGDRLIITDGLFKYAGKLGYINRSPHEVVSISGGTFDASSVVVDNGGTGNVLEYSIKGGTFHTDPSAYVVEGYYARNNGDGTWSVLPVVTIIKANQSVVGYPDLQSALNVVEDGDEILLNKSVTYSPDASYVASHRIIVGYNSILALDRSVEAVLNLQGNTITCNYPELSQAGYFFLISGDDSNKVFEIKNGEINIDWPNHQTHNRPGYGYETYPAQDAAIKLINSACMKITDITINTDSCGIILDNQSRITELNANVLCVREELDKRYISTGTKRIDPAVVNAFKCIIVGSSSSGTSCRIDLISGGMYSSTIGESAYDDDSYGRGFMGDNASVDIYSNCVIGKISGGVFTSDVFSGSGTYQRVCAIWVRTGGRIDSITGGEFMFTEPSILAGCYSLSNYPTFPLCIEGEGGVGSITGGLFQEGYFHYKEKPGMSVDSKGRFDSIVDASGCEKTIVEARAVTISAGTTYERVLDMYEIVHKSGD